MAELRPESICRPATGKCSGRRRRVPSCHPAVDSSHHHCCSIDAPAHERAEIGGRSNVASYFPINHPLPNWIERGGLLATQTALVILCSFFSLFPLCVAPGIFAAPGPPPTHFLHLRQFFRRRLRQRHIKLADEFQINLYFLGALAAGAVWVCRTSDAARTFSINSASLEMA